MAIEVNVAHLRQHLQDYLRRAQSGEVVRITSRGRVIARLVPDEESGDAAERYIAGLRGHCTVGDVISPVSATWEAAGARS